LFFCDANAQDKVSYGYDAAGNRISRTIVIAPSLRASEAEEEEATVYSEVVAELLIKVYPNPTQGLLHIEIENLPPDVTASIALYQLSGKLVTLKQDVTYSTEIDITGQAPGIYVLRIVAGEAQTEWKIIKK
ncbi:MAG: T9SS type A sorting domain-containing protein, partial [Prevotella sp.]|nr:T9SS type A sorting domain-containing protein [Prevotella sp.]